MPNAISYIEHPSDVIAHAARLTAQGRAFALITSVGIEGGAARDEGSLALVDETGAMVGYLSNGCIDKDIQFQAIEALRTSEKKLVRYGNGSQFADLSLPCGGALDVLIDPTPDIAALSAAHCDLENRRPTVLRFTLPVDGAPTLSFRYAPQFRLVLAGRGAVFRVMAELGVASGFQVRLMSPDEEDLDALATITGAGGVHLKSTQAEVRTVWLDPYAAFLTLFHDHDWEPALLQAALTSSACFIGSLGSRRTHEARIERLIAMGVTATDAHRVQGPIGLVPSLREALLIAVSALAQIVAHRPVAIERCLPCNDDASFGSSPDRAAQVVARADSIDA
ncbi:XdhC family protein [Loktanella sp. F6476L]|uniref:XdhC family protein n=1 Tax=Loktanella sp. F6476L TaxID=2926405 RepID=UPI001FF69478|nr:XdhC family protein [Loktanella sp. F6476L]MCK0119552.1 XdhC family protein [Loktanella sp. F6476L]